MSLLDKINDDLKIALKLKEELKVNTLRQIKASITNTEIKKGKTLTDEEIGEVVFSLVKSHNESIESFKKGNRPDLVTKEETEMEVLKQYMPKQLSDNEIKKIVEETIKELGSITIKDIGKIMGKVIPKVKGKADGNKVNMIVKEILAKF